MKNKLTVLSGIMLTATLLLTGCGSKKLDIDNKETSLKDETSVSIENNTTTQSNEEMPEGGYKYPSETGSAKLFAYELKEGKEVKTDVYPDAPITLNDGKARMCMAQYSSFEYNDAVIDSTNINYALVFHNGNYICFDTEDGTNKMYTSRSKNGEQIMTDFQVVPDRSDNKYTLINLARNELSYMDDYGELEISGLEAVTHDFVTEDGTAEKCEIVPYSEKYELEEGEVCSDLSYGQEIRKLGILEYGFNPSHEFVYQKDGKIYYTSLQCNQKEDEVNTEFNTIFICDDKVYPAFDGKEVLKYVIPSNGGIKTELDLSGLPKGEHIVFTITVNSNGDDSDMCSRSRYAKIVIE
jgi:major membrane immunogen (membrane-anchored lipoprotein)